MNKIPPSEGEGGFRSGIKRILAMLLLIFVLLPMLAALAVPQLLQWLSALGFLD